MALTMLTRKKKTGLLLLLLMKRQTEHCSVLCLYFDPTHQRGSLEVYWIC